MLRRADEIPDGTTLTADLVIVGGGAAGITLAFGMIGSGLSVVLLESGGEDPDPAVQALYEGRLGGRRTQPLDETRLRQFGGTTNHWAGWCRPLEAEDFRPRADWPASGWPFERTSLDVHYREAARLCELGPVLFDDLAAWREQGSAPLEALAVDAALMRTAVFQISPPTRFAEVHGPALTAAPNVTVILEATVLQVRAAEAGPEREVKRAAGVHARRSPRAGNADGATAGTFDVEARAVVIATGGIEVPRLLLLSTALHPAGAGNERDLVGRHFMDHPWIGRAAYLRFAEAGSDWPLYFAENEIGGGRMFGTLVPDPAYARAAGIGAFRLWFAPTKVSSAGLDSLRAVTGSLGRGEWPDDLGDHVGTMLEDIDVIADATYKSLLGTKKSPFLSKPKPGDPYLGAWVDLNIEQAPNPESRVRLDSAQDALGQRRVVLDWRLGESERRTAVGALSLFAREAGRLGLGRVRIADELTEPDGDWPERLTGSRHHIGTARMAKDPRHGVTDEWGRVHTVENLYVAGSALFPTSGIANPTLTIVALALRQAAHLREVLGAEGRR